MEPIMPQALSSTPTIDATETFNNPGDAVVENMTGTMATALAAAQQKKADADAATEARIQAARDRAAEKKAALAKEQAEEAALTAAAGNKNLTEKAARQRATQAQAARNKADGIAPPAPNQPMEGVKQAMTVEAVRAMAPTHTMASAISRRHALDAIDYEKMAAVAADAIASTAAVLTEAFCISDEREDAYAVRYETQAVEGVLQRLTGAYVGAAFSAAKLFQNRVSLAQEATTKSLNEDRDGDRDGVAGFDSKAARARHTAATTGLRAYTLLGMAEGAATAFEQATGNTWKPYDSNQTTTRTVSRDAIRAELDAFKR